VYKVNQDTYARVFRMLLDDPITAYDAAEETGMHVVTAQSLMRTLKKHKVVHVCAWEADALGRDTTPVYKLGHGKNKPRHKFTAAERQARSRAKKRKLILGLHNDRPRTREAQHDMPAVHQGTGSSADPRIERTHTEHLPAMC